MESFQSSVGWAKAKCYPPYPPHGWKTVGTVNLCPPYTARGLSGPKTMKNSNMFNSHPASALKGEEPNSRFLVKGEPLTVPLEGKEQSADSPTMTGGSGRRLPSPGWNVERESLYPRRLPSKPLNPVSFCPWSSVPARIGTGSAVHRNSGKEPERP